MNDGRVLMFKLYCPRCPGHRLLRGVLLCITKTKRTAERIMLAHVERTGHKAYQHHIVGRYVTPPKKGGS